MCVLIERDQDALDKVVLHRLLADELVKSFHGLAALGVEESV
jgi:hypothetical protein